MTGEIREPSIRIHRSDLIDRSPHHVRAVKIFSKRPRCMVHKVTADQVQTRNLASRFNLPILSGRDPGLFEKSIEKITMMKLFDAPAIHELPDHGISSGRCAP